MEVTWQLKTLLVSFNIFLVVAFVVSVRWEIRFSNRLRGSGGVSCGRRFLQPLSSLKRICEFRVETRRHPFKVVVD
jgi:hypothetical protein